MLKRFLNFRPVRYIRNHPFSVMAACNILGDMGYLGYAFAAQGFVSYTKLTGAGFAMLAHAILLAYGDDHIRQVAGEKGALSDFILKLRGYAQRLAGILPRTIHREIYRKPIGVTFSILMVNGIALFANAVWRYRHEADQAMALQIVLGTLIILGTGAYAVADFTRKQRLATRLTEIAPLFLSYASIVCAALALVKLDVFLMFSVLSFMLSNIAGFFVKIDKEKGQHLHS